MKAFYESCLLPAALVVIGLLVLACIVRSVRGPGAGDRLVAVNMMTTLVVIAVCVLTVLLGESYLADVALVFSLAGCLGVVVLTGALSAGKTEKEDERHVE